MKIMTFLFVFLIAAPLAWADGFALKAGEIYDKNGQAVMRECEKGENLPVDQRPADYCGHPYVVPYFKTQAEREPYRVVIENGQARRAVLPHEIYPDGEWYFVMDGAGNFYFFDKDGMAPLHHSSFFAGGPIASGGDLEISNGELTALGYYTGHYLMTPTILQNATQALSDDGVEVSLLKNLGGHK